MLIKIHHNIISLVVQIIQNDVDVAIVDDDDDDVVVVDPAAVLGR